MLELILMIIYGALSLYCGFLITRYNVHMLQLNGYKLSEYLSWFKDNFRLQWVLFLGIISSVVSLFFYQHLWLYIFNILIFLIYLWVYRCYKRINIKTPLVYTSRMKRLIFVLVIVNICLCILFFLYEIDFTYFLLLASIQPLLIIILSCLLYPIEYSIKEHYINDAKNILKQYPDLIIIGITGSYGKTSTKQFLYNLLQNDFNVLCTPGNYNTPMGVVKTIRNDLKPYHDIFICEMGARRVGDIKELCDIVNPTHGIITAIGPQHLSTFKNIRNIQKTKFELADAIDTNNILLLNADCELINEKASKYENAITYSINDTATYKATNIKTAPIGSSFNISALDDITFKTKLIGEHNIIDIMSAIIMAYKLGVDLDVISKYVLRLQSIEHRLQLKEISNDVTVIDNAYNSNPVSSKISLKTLDMFDGYKIVITPGLVELGKKNYKYNFNFGIELSRYSDYVLVVKNNAAYGILNAFSKHNFQNFTKCSNFDEAYTAAMNINADGKHKYILIENDLPDNF